MGKNINQIATEALSILATDKFYLGRSPYGVTDDRWLAGSTLLSETQFPWIFVGNTSECQYATIQSAIAAGEIYLYVVTDITETVNGTFSGNLFIKVLPGINITFNNATPFVATAGQHEFCIFSEGVYSLNYNFTSDAILFDFTQIGGSPPSYFGGTPIFSNNSSPGINVTPVKTAPAVTYLVEMDKVIYLMNNSQLSQFQLGYVNINTLVLVNVAGPVDTYGIQITDFGKINNLIVGNDLTSNSIIADVMNTEIDNFLSLSNTAAAQLNITNSSVLNGTSLNASTLVRVNTDTDSRSSMVLNFKNINLILLGYNSRTINCDCASINLNGTTGGYQIIANSTLASAVTLNNTNSQFKFSLCELTQGMTITNSFCTLVDGCTAGDITNPGQLYTITLGAGADNCFIANSYVDDDIIDNGTNNSYTYKVF